MSKELIIYIAIGVAVPLGIVAFLTFVAKRAERKMSKQGHGI